MAAPASLDPRPPPADDRLARFAELRARLSVAHREAAPEAFVPAGALHDPAEAGLLASGLGGLDEALGGGFPRGVISALEGGVGSGAVALRLLALATTRGLAALIERPQGAGGAFLPEALAAAGVDLGRLLVVVAADATAVARAVDAVLRSGAFEVVVLPPVVLAQTVWTRLASLAHRAGCVLVALGGAAASAELRFFASLRVRLRPLRVRWSGDGGIFATLAGLEIEATVLKHKRAAPGRTATFACTTFEGGPPLATLRDRVLVAQLVDRPALRRAIAAG